MEPLSIVGTASSIVSIIDIATRCISSLRALQQRWVGADWTVNLLVGQLVTVKAALDQIREWSDTNLSKEPQHHQLVMDLDTSLESCRLLISVIDSHVSGLEWDEANALTFGSKAKAVWKDQSTQDCVNHLHHQTVALNLLLTALNCRSLSDQRDMLLMSASRSIIDQVKDETSSLVCLRDYSSFRSPSTSSTNGSSLWSRNFRFDHELLASGVYQNQIRSLMRRTFRRRKTLDNAFSFLARENVRSVRKAELAKSVAMERQLRWDLSERDVVKILLLGSQYKEPFATLDMMNLNRIKKYSPDERACYRRIIFRCIIDTMTVILQELKGPYHRLNNARKHRDIKTIQHFLDLGGCHTLPSEVAIAILSLWLEEDVKYCFESCKRQIHWREPEHYLDSISRIAQPEYIPTDRDLLFTMKPCGVIKNSSGFDPFSYRFVKPGPENMCRPRTRLTMFDYDTVVFEVDVSLYDEVGDETVFTQSDASREGAVSLLDIALSEFEVLCAKHYTEWDLIVLVLNQHALFRDKVRTKSDLQTWYPDYTGGSDDTMATDYVVGRFSMLNRNQNQPIYTYCVGDSDPDIARCIISAVNDAVIQAKLSHPT